MVRRSAAGKTSSPSGSQRSSWRAAVGPQTPLTPCRWLTLEDAFQEFAKFKNEDIFSSSPEFSLVFRNRCSWARADWVLGSHAGPGPVSRGEERAKGPGAPGTWSQHRRPWGTRRLSSRTQVTGRPGLSPEAAGKLPAPHSAKVALPWVTWAPNSHARVTFHGSVGEYDSRHSDWAATGRSLCSPAC